VKAHVEAKTQHASKTCVTCGREITWRKKWERDWDSVKYCSDPCRSHKPRSIDTQLEAAILKLLSERGAGKTICPSEAARAVAPSSSKDDWEPLMEPARQAARRLVADGKILITQGGVVADPSRAKGAIRLRLV
jgi:hypothetical protein